ncbi:anti-sigma-K factor RskA [Roseivirga pacifica]|uniref:Regulator of SigK n=1 Tax=Roseivirga pacifica TaxID=1267423 RepID=A0A1I0M344_9BACT|nr:anti-sigma factor [Roseivirga pacifica]RKQ50023.1 anti-sigma-K factor RskA [Roseivirga pacifica]SEV82773.1 Anti-sigma-K factor RskA [Roseivirga pacifica]
MDIKEYISSGILEAYALDGLSSEERRGVEDMLAQYPELRAELNAIEEGLEALALETAITPPSDLGASILSQIEDKEAPAGATAETKVVAMQPKTSVWAYVAAASIALAAIASFLAYDYHTKWQSAQNAFAQLQANNELMASQYNQVNQKLEQLEDDIEIIGNSDFQRVNMGAVNEGDNYTASIYWNAKTEEAFLSIQNLKQLSEEQQYQLWAIVDGKPVDMGVFDFDVKGLLKMKSVANAATFAVTIEPKGGSVNPTLEAMQVAGNVG